MFNQLYIMKLVGYFILCIFLGWLLTKHRHEFIALYAQIEFSKLWPLLLLQVPLIAMNGLPFKTLCLPLGFSIRWQDWAGLSYISNFLNQVLPYRPGLGVRYYYLNKKYKITLQQFIYVSITNLLLTSIIATLLICAAWGFGGLPIEHQLQTFYIVCGLMSFVIIIGLIKLKSSKLNTAENLEQSRFNPLKILIKIYSNAQFIFKTPSILIQSGAILLGANLLTVITFYWLFIVLNAPLPLGHCAFFVGLTTLSMLFPLTPGNIGIAESIIGGVTQALYGDFSLGFGAIIVYRACQLVISLTLGSAFSLLLLDKNISELKGLK